MKLLKHLFLIKYIARQGVEMLQPKKRLQKGISFQELVEELARLESARLVTKIFPFITTTQFVASV
jgi:hypothetical protein